MALPRVSWNIFCRVIFVLCLRFPTLLVVPRLELLCFSFFSVLNHLYDFLPAIRCRICTDSLIFLLILVHFIVFVFLPCKKIINAYKLDINSACSVWNDSTRSELMALMQYQVCSFLPCLFRYSSIGYTIMFFISLSSPPSLRLSFHCFYDVQNSSIVQSVYAGCDQFDMNPLFEFQYSAFQVC